MLAQPTTEDLELGPDTRLIARRLISEGRRLKKPVPTLLDLATAITAINIHDTMAGSSSLTVSITDENLVLTTSGFLDADADGKLDKIDLNYPDGSDQWWRLSTVSVTSRETLDLAFMERPAAWLLELRGPIKAARGSVTRAEFLKMLVEKHKLGLDFHSHDLHVSQAVEITPPTDPGKTAKGKKTPAEKTKAKGIPGALRPLLTSYDGAIHQLSKEEVANAETVMAAAEATTKDERATLALLCACIVEAPFFANPVGGDASSSGILQLLSNHLGGSTSTRGGRRDITLVATQFLTLGFSGRGGAIQLAKDHPTWTPGQIAQAVQGSAYPDRYQKVVDGAQTVMIAYASGALSGLMGVAGLGKQKSQYNFQVGSSANPRETYWDGMQRLASEVGWALFTDENDVYFDPETTLIQQKPAALIRRTDPAVVDWSYDWDQRQIATEMELLVICEPFAFRAGEVLLLDDFGTASTGSTVKLPGRWLISEIDRDRSSWTSTLTLKQPKFPGPEPATQTTDLPDTGKGDATTAGKAYAEAVAIDAKNLPYGPGGHGQSWADAEDAATLDCSSSTSLALHAAGLMGGASGPQVSGWFLTWGESGKGKHMTVWVKPGLASQGHVWIEFYGRKATRFDTSPWGSGGSGPHLRFTPRSTDGFVARRFPGDV